MGFTEWNERKKFGLIFGIITLLIGTWYIKPIGKFLFVELIPMTDFYMGELIYFPLIFSIGYLIGFSIGLLFEKIK